MYQQQINPEPPRNITVFLLAHMKLGADCLMEIPKLLLRWLGGERREALAVLDSAINLLSSWRKHRTVQRISSLIHYDIRN